MRTEQDKLRDGVPREQVFQSVSAASAENSGRVRLSDAVAEYNSELHTLDKSKATITAYVNTLEGFSNSYRKEFLDEIRRKDILGGCRREIS